MNDTIHDFGDGLTWRKSRRSSDQGGNCVFLAGAGNDRFGILDSKEGSTGPRLWLSGRDLGAFLNSMRK